MGHEFSRGLSQKSRNAVGFGRFKFGIIQHVIVHDLTTWMEDPRHETLVTHVSLAEHQPKNVRQNVLSIGKH